MTSDDPDVTAAYQLKTPDDSRALYARWAESYDAGFVVAEDYQLHSQVARVFVGAGGAGPVLDLGAGTGICGQALAERGVGPVDAADISREMLDEAGKKGAYRALIEADLTQEIPVPDGCYAGIVSSGTFTTGHVGPDALDEVLRIADAAAVFTLSVNAQHFEAAGFAAKFDSLSDQIADLRFEDVRIYGPSAKGTHKDDLARLAVFRKVG